MVHPPTSYREPQSVTLPRIIKPCPITVKSKGTVKPKETEEKKHEVLTPETLECLCEIWNENSELFTQDQKNRVLHASIHHKILGKDTSLSRFIEEVSLSISSYYSQRTLQTTDFKNINRLIKYWCKYSKSTPNDDDKIWSTITSAISAHQKTDTIHLIQAIQSLAKAPSKVHKVIYKRLEYYSKRSKTNNKYRLSEREFYLLIRSKYLSYADGEIKKSSGKLISLTENGWTKILKKLNIKRPPLTLSNYKFKELSNQIANGLANDLNSLSSKTASEAAFFASRFKVFTPKLMEAYLNYSYNNIGVLKPRDLLRFFIVLSSERVHSQKLREEATKVFQHHYKELVDKGLYVYALRAFALENSNEDMHKVWNTFISYRYETSYYDHQLVKLHQIALARNLTESIPSDLNKIIQQALINEVPPVQANNKFESEVSKALVCLGYDFESQSLRSGYLVDFIVRKNNQEIRVACDGALFHRVGGKANGPFLGRDIIKEQALKNSGISSIHIVHEEWKKHLFSQEWLLCTLKAKIESIINLHKSVYNCI